MRSRRLSMFENWIEGFAWGVWAIMMIAFLVSNK